MKMVTSRNANGAVTHILFFVIWRIRGSDMLESNILFACLPTFPNQRRFADHADQAIEE